MSPQPRIEHDMIGEISVPADAYYGAHTARALVNFPITRETLADRPRLVAALDRTRAEAIATACVEIRAGVLSPAAW